MSLGPSSGPGAGRASEDGLDAALTGYAGFLGHQLAELVLLLSAAGDGGPAAAARTRLQRMLADLRDLAPVPGPPADVDLLALSREVAGELGEPGRRAQVVADGTVLPVRGDSGLLRALIGHLLRPGLASANGGARFSLATTATGDGRVLVRLVEHGGPERAARAKAELVPFARPAGSGPLIGAGVSGPAAARIVAAHGGALRVEPHEHGSLAVFSLAAGSS